MPTQIGEQRADRGLRHRERDVRLVHHFLVIPGLHRLLDGVEGVGNRLALWKLGTSCASIHLPLHGVVPLPVALDDLIEQNGTDGQVALVGLRQVDMLVVRLARDGGFNGLLGLLQRFVRRGRSRPASCGWMRAELVLFQQLAIVGELVTELRRSSSTM